MKPDYLALLDAGLSPDLKSFFRRAEAKTTLEVGLRQNADDRKIVRVAEFEDRLILTHDHGFRNHIQAFQADHWGSCLRGIVRLPNDFTKQREILNDLRYGRRRLTFKGRPVTFEDVWLYNLFVPCTVEGDPIVAPLCRCGEEAFDEQAD